MENNLQINIFHIQKRDEFESWSKKYAKLISKFANLEEYNLFNKKIALAQNLNPQAAKKSYEEVFMPHRKNFSIILDQGGKALTSAEFAKLIRDKRELNFFIGGAYGLDEKFSQSSDFRLCVSKLTLTHQFVKILLLEQIYRAFCIICNHPYHK